MSKPRIRLVLVATRTPGNIGACARLAACFDVSDWFVVSPRCSWDGIDARKYATGSSEARLDSIQVVDTVEEAVADCQVAIGFSRRVGKVRALSLNLDEATALANETNRIALVFGNEESGLTREELKPCTHLCALETSEEQPSLNLSHAVAVALSSFYRHHHALPAKGPGTKTQPPARLAELQGLMGHWRELLLDLGMNRGGNPERMLVSLRGIFDRSALAAQEIRALRGVLARAQVKIGTRTRGTRSVTAPVSGPEDSSEN